MNDLVPNSLRGIDLVFDYSDNNSFGISVETTIVGIDLGQQRSITEVFDRF